MTFDDLPHDWDSHPLTDASLRCDVVDLFVKDADRLRGGLGVLLCDADGMLLQPIMIEGMNAHANEPDIRATLAFLQHLQADGTLTGVLALARPRGSHDDDVARFWARIAADECQQAAIGLLGFYIATPEGVGEVSLAQAA